MWSERRLFELLLSHPSGHCLSLLGSHKGDPLETGGPEQPWVGPGGHGLRAEWLTADCLEWGWAVTGSPGDPGLASQAEAGVGTLAPAQEPLTPSPSSRQRWMSARGPTAGAVSSGASTPWAATSAAVTPGTSWPPTSATVRVRTPRPTKTLLPPQPTPPRQTPFLEQLGLLGRPSPPVGKEHVS